MPTRAQLEYDRMIQAKEKIQDNAKTAVKDKLIIKSIEIVRAFIQHTQSICYGGTAVNNILPTSAQFYDKNEVPDYDFYHYDALSIAKKLADILHKQGFISSAKAGVHTNTYKVYANFVPLADITHCDRPLYDELKKRAIKKAGILYADPNFLRMSMYLELSRPNGDISRWEKIMSRLQLLNTHYPIQVTCTPRPIEESDQVDPLHTYIWNECVRENVVFLSGVFAHLTQKKGGDSYCIDGFHVAPDVFMNRLNQTVRGKLTYYPPVGEIVPECFELVVQGKKMVRIYRTIACHSFNEIVVNRQKIRLATIDTLMNMTLALSYIGVSEKVRHHYLCMAQYIFQLYQKHKLTTHGMFNRFPLTCLGKQDTLLDILRTKYEIYNEMKQNPNFMRKYDMYFLNYNPADKESDPTPPKRKKTMPNTKTKKMSKPNTKKTGATKKKMARPTIQAYLKHIRNS
jgi:hypothetical protein